MDIITKYKQAIKPYVPKPSRVIKTVATPECEKGLKDLIKSLRKHDWKENIYVYTTTPNWDINWDGVIFKHIPAWWTPGSAIDICRNKPALIKPELFLDEKEGTTVLYVDGGDVVFLENPIKLFHLFENSKSILGAYPFKTGRRVCHDHPVIKALLGEDIWSDRGDYVNNGVIIAKINPLLKMTMKLWKAYLGYTFFAGHWKIGSKQNRVVGDQEAFNVVRRTLRNFDPTAIYNLPQIWNYRGGEAIKRNLRPHNGMIHDKEGNKINLVHCSGRGEMPDWIKEMAC